MSANPSAVVLELAALPRAQIGPFILLGVDKLADKDQIEAAWAQRLIWARKNQIAVPLEDINWAREMLNDLDKRVRADAASLNVDTSDGLLRRLQARYGPEGSGCRPLDVEKSLADYTPPIAVPDIEEVRSQLPLPEVPREFPAVARLLDNLAKEPLEPWDDNINQLGNRQ